MKNKVWHYLKSEWQRTMHDEPSVIAGRFDFNTPPPPIDPHRIEILKVIHDDFGRRCAKAMQEYAEKLYDFQQRTEDMLKDARKRP